MTGAVFGSSPSGMSSSSQSSEGMAECAPNIGGVVAKYLVSVDRGDGDVTLCRGTSVRTRPDSIAHDARLCLEVWNPDGTDGSKVFYVGTATVTKDGAPDAIYKLGEMISLAPTVGRV